MQGNTKTYAEQQSEAKFNLKMGLLLLPIVVALIGYSGYLFVQAI